MTLNDILNVSFVKDLMVKISKKDLQIIKRPACFFIKRPKEDEHNINRLIILPPHGYTSNEANQTNCFEGVKRATIKFKGAVREGKQGFSKMEKGLLQASFNQNSLVSALDRPYVEFNLQNPAPNLQIKYHTSHTPPFHVVKEDGTGFYHTLVNVTDDWLVLELHKVLRPQKTADINSQLINVQDELADILRKTESCIKDIGDRFFYNRNDLVEAILDIPPSISLPALGEMLYIRDTGKHETCTAFGLILKIAQEHPQETLKYLSHAKRKQLIPTYFAEQLIKKIKNKMVQNDILDQELQVS